VAERGALFLVAVDAALQGVDVEEYELAGAGQQVGSGGDADQQLTVDRAELAHVAVAKRAQERSERGGRTDPVERQRHSAVAEQVHVVDAVGAGDHPGQQCRNLDCRVRTGYVFDVEFLVDEVVEMKPIGELGQARQASARHEIRVVEGRRRSGRRMQ